MSVQTLTNSFMMKYSKLLLDEIIRQESRIIIRLVIILDKLVASDDGHHQQLYDHEPWNIASSQST